MIYHQEKLQLVKQLIEQGLTKKQISEQANIPFGSISKFLEFHRLKTKQARGKGLRGLTKKTRYDYLKPEIETRLISGETTFSIADALSIPRGSMGYLVQCWGFQGIQYKARGGFHTKDGLNLASKKISESHKKGRKHPTEGKIISVGVSEEELVSQLKVYLFDEDLTNQQAADKLGCNYWTVTRLIEKYQLYRGQRSGSRHHDWKGGHSKYRGPDFYQNRKLCLERDKYTCQHCGKTNEQEKTQTNRSLNAHHVIPYRISFDSSLSNLITLCQSCHMKEEKKSGVWAKKK